MVTHTVVLKLDHELVQRVDKAVAESRGVFTSRSHLLRQLIAGRYPVDTVWLREEAKPVGPGESIEDVLARAEAAVQREIPDL